MNISLDNVRKTDCLLGVVGIFMFADGGDRVSKNGIDITVIVAS